jgi:ornithine cyclodeaminase/alanine dehydrogenase-like protein (mu-crystallin family)
MLVINDSEVRTLLRMQDCIAVMENALISLALGEVILPLRPVMWLPDKTGALALMPTFRSHPSGMAVKVISVFPGNRETPYDSHQGGVLLFDTTFGQLLAMIDASSVTAIRTAAVSGVATKLLAREDAGDLAILGSGVQARTHLEAMLCCRKIRRVRVWSRHRDHAHTFADQESKRFGLKIEVSLEPKEAVRGADLICTTTTSSLPILMGEWIANGAHINAVGGGFPGTRELSSLAVAKSQLFVDRRESALNEAGDFLIPKKEGWISDDHIRGEIGEILTGKILGRKTPEEITLFKSLGIAIEDLAAAQFIYAKAMENNVGTQVELGGKRLEGN